MVWFDSYESKNTKNKWHKLSIAAQKRAKAKKVLGGERKREERKFKSYLGSATATGSALNERTRDRTTAYTTKTTPRYNRRKYSSAQETTSYINPRKGYLARSPTEIEAEAVRTRKEKLDSGRRAIGKIDQNLMLQDTVIKIQQTVDSLSGLTPAEKSALRLALNPNGYIPLDSFTTNFTKDIVTDIRGGNIDRILEAQENSLVMNNIMDEAKKFFLSKFDKPAPFTDSYLGQTDPSASKGFEFFDTPEAKLKREEDLAKEREEEAESIGFNPTLREFKTYTPDELVELFQEPYTIDDDGNRIQSDVALLSGKTRLLFGTRDLEVHAMTLTEEEAIDFIGKWLESQQARVGEGNLNQIEPVPYFGGFLREEALRILDLAANEKRKLTDEEMQQVVFYSYAGGMWNQDSNILNEQKLTDEQRDNITSLKDEISGEDRGSGIFGIPGAIRDVTGDASDFAVKKVEDIPGIGGVTGSIAEFARDRAEGVVEGIEGALSDVLGTKSAALGDLPDPTIEIMSEQELFRGKMPPTVQEFLNSKLLGSLLAFPSYFYEGDFLDAFTGDVASLPFAPLKIINELGTGGADSAIWAAASGGHYAFRFMNILFERGETVSRPFVQKALIPFLSRAADPMGAIGEDVTGTPSKHRGIRNAIESNIVEEGLVEILNPANVVFVIPFVGPGSRFARAMAAGNRAGALTILADEFMFLGNTPQAITGIGRLLAYTSRNGLKATLKMWPGAANNKPFMNLMRGLDKKVVKREVEHEITNLSRDNMAILQQIEVLKILKYKPDSSVADLLKKGFDEKIVQQTINQYNGGRGIQEYTLRKFDPETGKDAIPGLERIGAVKEALEGKSSVGEGFKDTGGIRQTEVGKGINFEVDRLLDEMNSFDTTFLSSKQGRQTQTKIQKQAVETMAYGLVIDNPKLGNKLSQRLSNNYDEFDGLLNESNGLLTSDGKFISIGNQTPESAIKNIWSEEEIPNAVNFLESTKATENDVSLATITRFMDETGTIAISRQGDDKIVIEAVRYIDEVQAKSIRNLIKNEDIKEISFSFDGVYGTRASDKQTLYRGETGKEFDDILTDSTGVCSL